MKTLHVELGERSYPIYIGEDLLADRALLAPFVRGREVMVVSNDRVAPLYLEEVRKGLVGSRGCETVILPDGERHKNLDTLNMIFDALLEARMSRKCVLVALGGGVVGDMTGFAAACYQRGVDFIQIPTTLLAQVDSSVGGKTGVNHALGKNMIGAFHQPLCVLADTATLKTLEARELHAGIAEVIKYGLIRDRAFFDWLESVMPSLMARDEEVLAGVIEQSCLNKADIVAADEREGGIRALLNLGHTFGHAIETGMGYGEWLHGEAVATGMCMAARMSQAMGWLDEEDVVRIVAVIAAAGLPVAPPSEMSARHFMELMAVDKKVEAGVIRLILLKAIGDAVIFDEYDPGLLEDVIEQCRVSDE